MKKFSVLLINQIYLNINRIFSLQNFIYRYLFENFLKGNIYNLICKMLLKMENYEMDYKMIDKIETEICWFLLRMFLVLIHFILNYKL